MNKNRIQEDIKKTDAALQHRIGLVWMCMIPHLTMMTLEIL